MTQGGSMLAALLNPALFAGGLAAVGVPILIHLLARRRFRRVRWAAMAFLLDAEKRNRRRVRLEELILLALRCLAVLLIGLFVARPFLKPSGIAAVLGGADRTERIFLIDDSFSMGYVTDGVTALARAKEGVANLVQRLREHAPGDTVTLLRASEPQTPIVLGAVLDERQVEQLLARVEAIEPSQLALSAPRCLDAIEELLGRDAGTLSAVLYVLSDFQRVDWVKPTSAGTAAGVTAGGLEAWAGAGRGLRVVLVDVGDDSAENTAITALTAQPRQIVTGVETRLEASVGNFTAAELPRVDLDVAVAQQPAATVAVEHVSAGGVTPAALPVAFAQPGDQVVHVEIAPDNLPVDNAANLVAHVSEAVRVLVVNGEPSSDPYLDEVALLETALRPAGDVFSGVAVDTIEEAALEGARLGDYDLVILCNLYRISEPVADGLHAYVAGGGGLLVFLGDQVSDPVLYNATLYRGGAGLLPASLQTVVAAPEGGVRLAGGDWRHPVVQVFAGDDNPFRQRLRFMRYFATEPAPAEEAAPGSEPAGAAPRRPAARVLARFDDAEQTAALVERPFGDGRVMLFPSSCDLEWNDWARDPSFVVTLQELVQYLARASAGGPAVRVGEPIRLALDPSRFEAAAVVRGPAYPQEEETEISAEAGENGLQLRWELTNRAGVYTLLLRERSGGQVVRRVAVTLDPAESDLRPAGEDELRPVFGSLPVEYVAGAPQRENDSDEGRREVWPIVLVAALGVLMLEQFLAWRFGRV